MKSTACLAMSARLGRGALRIERLQPVAEAGNEPLLEMDRRLHIGLGVADDRPPGAGGDRNVLATGQRQRVEDDVGDLLDAAGRARHGRHAFELQLRRGRGEQHGEDVVARRIHVENDAFHLTPLGSSGTLGFDRDSARLMVSSVSWMMRGRAR